MRAWFCSAVLLAACAGSPPRADGLNAAASDYVRLALEIDRIEPGYVDAYIGDPNVRAAVRAGPARTAAELALEAQALSLRLERASAGSERDRARKRYLAASLHSMRFRLAMLEGERRPFLEEAQALFGLRPALRPLSHYDSALARLEDLAPGEGPLAERVEAVRARYAIPADRLLAVMEAAIAACRERTAEHIALPPDESFTLQLTSGQNWSAYNWYQGENASLIQVNTDLQLTIDRALGLGCHEGYPGHHVQGLYAEANASGAPENLVLLLYNPAAPLWEGGANYAIELAFPGDERLTFERDTLFPLAGLDPDAAQNYAQLRAAMGALAGARLTIAQRYLDGEIDREAAIALTQRYQLVSRARAEQSVRFAEQYRSYVINYVSGEEIVRAYVEAAGESAQARWAAYERLISTPVLPNELTP